MYPRSFLNADEAALELCAEGHLVKAIGDTLLWVHPGVRDWLLRVEWRYTGGRSPVLTAVAATVDEGSRDDVEAAVRAANAAVGTGIFEIEGAEVLLRGAVTAQGGRVVADDLYAIADQARAWLDAHASTFGPAPT